MVDPVAKPGITEAVFFYDPELTRRIGFANGYGMRGEGPYAGLVVNDNRPADELDIYVFYPDLQPAFVRERVKMKPETPDPKQPAKPYWAFTSAAQEARAIKALNAKLRAKQKAEEDAKPPAAAA